MLIDKRNEFADATALSTAGAATILFGDVIDTGGDGINDVENLYLIISVDTAVTSGGSATVQFHLCSDAQAAIAVDGTATYHWSSPAIAKATLVAGYRVCALALPKGTYERYLGIVTTIGTAALTAGKVNAFLTPSAPTWTAFPAGAGHDIT